MDVRDCDTNTTATAGGGGPRGTRRATAMSRALEENAGQFDWVQRSLLSSPSGREQGSISFIYRACAPCGQANKPTYSLRNTRPRAQPTGYFHSAELSLAFPCRVTDSLARRAH